MLKVSLTTIALLVCSTHATDIEFLTRGIANFSTDLFQEIAQSKQGNFVISPFSTAFALSLFSQATNGQTFEELQKGLHLNSDKAKIADRFHEYFELVQKSAGGSELLIANHIYVKNDHELKADFQEVADKVFHSGVEKLNFMESADAAKVINQFVDEKTKGNIKTIVKPAMFNQNTSVVLVNAVTFKSLWVKGFPKIWNKKRDFYISETEKIQIDSMHTVTAFHNAIIPELNAQALRMDYANSNLSFIAILPKNRTGLPMLEAQIRNYSLKKIVDQMQLSKQYVTLPMFTIETEIHLNDILTKMGMAEMFTTKADLSGLAESTQPLYVSDIIHKATIKINDERLEDAAKREQGKTNAANLHFLCDHPFMYYIWGRETNTTILSGRFIG